LFGVKRKQPHELKRVGMPGIERKRALATDLRVQRPSCPQMTKASLVERSSGLCVTFRSRRRLAGGNPAFTTVHLRTSVECASTSRVFLV
jgi:hypothetical protein